MKSDSRIVWSYSYRTKKTGTTWAHRMDHYYKIGSTNIHWLQIIASLFCIAFLGTVLCLLLGGKLNSDFNELQSEAVARA